MRLKPLLFCALLHASLAGPAFASEKGMLEDRDWPPYQRCSGCVALQYGWLELKVPQHLVGKFFVPPAGDPFIAFAPTENGLLDGPLIQLKEFTKLQELYQKLGVLEKHGIQTPLAFYELLGQANLGDPVIDRARKVEGVANSVRYEKFSKGPITAIRIQDIEPSRDLLYIFTPDPEHYYMVSGRLSPALFRQLMSHLKVVKFP
ncbi:hypothetical protein AVME950_15270 [Acidovorax sp. SUPP950]|uniref:hypothetical protein n=1 Tax=unclassified Acidovorax TaxID=2684926 RepID=UPI0023C5C5F9|nr:MULTISPECIES: hypothetical protein [Comamonadaceae]WOI46260.1 hypothetical protein R1Z03_03345 [Paracidovorax avenae]GKS76272.1 hypothetical protein AVME950_15270 [Acidovorax sp. SUPP950]GKS94810.1 hypothetical protein AVAK2825_09765 [Acidovorax sp. SUPP2825]